MTPVVIVSSIALVFSVISLRWQIWSWWRSGPVVVVAAHQSLPTYDGGVGEWHVDVTARNTGRVAVQVTGRGLATPTGSQLVVMQPVSWSTPLPHTLEHGSAASWFVPTGEIRRACGEQGIRYQDLRAFVRLGTGATVRARDTGIGLT